MSYRQLGRQLQNYEQSIPEYLQRFFAEYSADPYQSTVIDELQRRSGQSLRQNLGSLAGYYGNAGRMGGGLMGRAMSDAIAENMQRERGDIGGLMSQDYQGHLQRMIDAAGLMSGIQQTGMGGLASGYGADQQRAATIGAANIAADASRYATDANRALGFAGLDLNRQGMLFDQDYRNQMMPYNQLNMLSSGYSGLTAPYATGNRSGYTQGPAGSKAGGFLQGAAGGAAGGAGIGSMIGRNRPPSRAISGGK